MEAVFLFGLFILLLMLSVPIGYAIGMVTLVTMLHFTSMPTLMIAQNSIAGVDSFPLLAIPFFMLAGNLMSGGGIAKRLVNFFECFIGHITGGLGMVTIIVCMFFAAISGSAVATVSAVGAFMIPQMVEHGYSKPFSAALTAAAGTIGVIIPPSVPFVIYGVVSGASITSLFTAGFLPGILMGVALMIVCFIVSKKRGYRGSTEPPSASVIWVTFKDAIWAILSPVIILGGIYSGKFTPTEAAVISVVYSYVVGRFVYKELDGSSTYKALKDAIVINGATTFMVGLSTAFAALLTMEQIPMKIAGFITSISQNGFVILLLINLSTMNLGRLSGQSAQPGLSVKTLGKQVVKVPPLTIQNKIVSILAALDTKIEDNEKINKNLERQAQAIYTEMFITNADPTWSLGHLSDLITVKYGKDHKKLSNGEFPVYGSGGIMRYVERPLYNKESVLVPRKGTLNNVLYVNEPFWSVDTMFYTEMRQSNIAKYVFHYLKGKDLASMNAGSAVPSMTTAILNAMELRIPDANTLKRFEDLVSPMYVAMADNNTQSAKLEALRDTLLPRLMSGEIDVSNLDL